MAFEDKIQSLVDSASATSKPEDLLMTAVAANKLSSNVSSFIDTITNIPDLYATPMVDGTIIFVSELNTYLISNVYSWYSLDGRLYRNDGPTNIAWAWGGNSSAQLGDGTTISKSSPVSVIGGFTDWANIYTSNVTNLGIRFNNTLWSWGSSANGVLGNYQTVTTSPVSVVGGFADWCQASVGYFHGGAIRTNGTLWMWGNNANGQLGDNSTISKSSPVSVVGGFTDWCQVSAGRYNSIAVRKNGTAWSWGRNQFGILGTGNQVSTSSPVSVVGGFTDWCQVSAGENHTVAIRSNGTAWAWGWGTYGRLGNNSIIDKSSPVSVAGGFTDWCQIETGKSHTVAVRSNGTLWSWGKNSGGQLGDDSTFDRSSPVSVVGGFTDWCQVSTSDYHAIAVRTNGTAWSWGLNSNGRLGDNSTINKTSPVSVVGGITTWKQVSAGSIHSVAVQSC